MHKHIKVNGHQNNLDRKPTPTELSNQAKKKHPQQKPYTTRPNSNIDDDKNRSQKDISYQSLG